MSGVAAQWSLSAGWEAFSASAGFHVDVFLNLSIEKENTNEINP
jgi:hypothetical protein